MILRWILDDGVVGVMVSICQVFILSSIAISSRANLVDFLSLGAMAVVSIGSVGIGELQLQSLDGA